MWSIYTGRPPTRRREIPRQFHDISLTVRGTPAHVKCYSYHACTSVIISGGHRNATVHDPTLSVTHIMPVLVLLSVVDIGMQQCMIQNQMKWTSSAKSRLDANTQLTINSFMPLFPGKIFSPDICLTFRKTPYISLTVVKSLTLPGFPDKWSPCLHRIPGKCNSRGIIWPHIRPVQAVSEDIFIRTVRPRRIVNCLIVPPRNILTYLLTYTWPLAL